MNLLEDISKITNLEVAKTIANQSLSNFLRLFDYSPACMSLTTLDRKYFKVNKKFLEKFEYEEEELVGKRSVDIGILNEEESIKVSQLIEKNGKLQNDMVLCFSKSRKPIHTISSIEQIELNGEKYLLSSFLDISKLIHQQAIIEKQNKEILESINYARLIQNTILPNDKNLEEQFPNSFVLNKPKDIVSGDFFWLKKIENRIYIACCDCTGHGVPGAMISILAYKLLNTFISEYNFSKPAEILNQLNKEIEVSQNQTEMDLEKIKDGMDISLCVIDMDSMVMEYSGAYNPLYLIRKGELQKLKVDKIPINLFNSHYNLHFNNYAIQLEKGDLLYLFSDGYADQFGGPYGKKFQYKNFQNALLAVHPISLSKQKILLDETIEEWRRMSGEEQTDDILIVGIEI